MESQNNSTNNTVNNDRIHERELQFGDDRQPELMHRHKQDDPSLERNPAFQNKEDMNNTATMDGIGTDKDYQHQRELHMEGPEQRQRLDPVGRRHNPSNPPQNLRRQNVFLFIACWVSAAILVAVVAGIYVNRDDDDDEQ